MQEQGLVEVVLDDKVYTTYLHTLSLANGLRETTKLTNGWREWELNGRRHLSFEDKATRKRIGPLFIDSLDIIDADGPRGRLPRLHANRVDYHTVACAACGHVHPTLHCPPCEPLYMAIQAIEGIPLAHYPRLFQGI